MSLKVNEFRQFIANPQNTHNFEVVIPGLDEYAFTIQSTTFPGENTRVTQLYTAGEPIWYPTISETSHQWGIRIPEGDEGTAFRRMEDLRRRYWDQRNGTMNVIDWDDYIVKARDLNGNVNFHVVLHGCWVQGRGTGGIQLDASNPTNNWQWDYTIVFQWIEDKHDR